YSRCRLASGTATKITGGGEGSLLLFGSFLGETASAQKTGGVLRIYHWDSPASMSIHEEATYSTVVPMMGFFNNLVMYKQDEPKNSLKSIVPDLVTRWSFRKDPFEIRRERSGLYDSPLEGNGFEPLVLEHSAAGLT